MDNSLSQLHDNLQRRYPNLEICALIGSRARGDHRADSDWDFAIQWPKDQLDPWETLAQTEQLRQDLANWVSCAPEAIDLVELAGAGLAIRAAIAEEGIPLKGGEDLPWFHFLSRTWRELEDYYWDDIYAVGMATRAQPTKQ